MQAAIVLAAESRAAIYHLPLPAWPDLRRHLGADRAAVAARADELELDPVGPHPLAPSPFGRGGTPGKLILIDQRPALLIRHDDIEQPAIEKIGQRDTAAVEQVGDTSL